MVVAVHDVVIRGGTVAAATGTMRADVGIAGEIIVALGAQLPAGQREIDATGKLVVPGGIDAHAHIEQLSAAGFMNADSWESATASAAYGGTTTVLAFAAQHIGMHLPKVVADYAALARRGAVIDYAFHIIVADPTPQSVREHLPLLINAGHASIKVFMTYERMRVEDEALLDILLTARENKALVCVHAENHGMIAWMAKRLQARGYTAP
jgi:dihydropyrimidinase